MEYKKKALIIATIGGFLPVSEINNAILLQKLGFEVHYAANMKNKIYEFEEQDLIDRGIQLHHVDFSKNPFHFVSLVNCTKKIEKIIEIEQIQVVHCHTPVGGVAGRIASYFAKRYFIKKKQGEIPYVIYTAHGFHFYKGAPVFHWLCYYPVEYLLSGLTDCLITINAEDYYQAKRMRCKTCIKIPGVGIDLERFCPMERKEYGKPIPKRKDDKFRIISIGELNKNKNHRVVIEAIARLKDETIIYEIYGNGNGKQKLEQCINKNGLKTQVHIMGFDMQIEERLLQADCCVFPSIREGLGLAALEAMACKVPLIVSDNRGTREFAEHEKNCIVCEADNVQQFAQALLRIKNDKTFVEMLTKNAYETVQKFSVQESTKMMRTVYEKI